MKKNIAFVLTIALALAITLITPRASYAADDSAALYKTKCASCHGATGAADTTIGKKENLRALGSAEVQAQTDQQLFDWTAKGKAKMPAYAGKLTDEQIKGLVAFMRTLKK